jgi:23S rRNA (adenine2503-C2)-methyltransferase
VSGQSRQVKPRAEGWTQRLDAEGRPLLEFAPKKKLDLPPHVVDLGVDGSTQRVTEAGFPSYRTKQVFTHYTTHYTSDPEAMTDLPADSRHALAGLLVPALMTQLRRVETDSGDTIKFLWRLGDGALVESVLMRYPGRITLCISSQAGCGMNCPFCATGQAGLQRNLHASEIVEQVVRANRVITEGGFGRDPKRDPSQPERVTNIVFMGMGEPLANYARVMTAIRFMVADQPWGLGMSARHITVSTVGLAPAIHKLAAEDIPLTFALSLHAPDDELRNDLIPVNSKWDVDEVLDAAKAYFDKTGRRVSIEYALIRDMNDQVWRADMLADKLNARGLGWVHVNPIPLNPTPGSVWTASTRQATRAFLDRLTAKGIPATLRDTRGKEIDGACGQLAAAEA